MGNYSNAADVVTIRDLFISVPANTPISTEHLMERSGLDLRGVRDVISQLVRSGVPIISTRDGSYVLCTDRAVLARELARLRSQSQQIALRADGLATYLLMKALHDPDEDLDDEDLALRDAVN